MWINGNGVSTLGLCIASSNKISCLHKYCPPSRPLPEDSINIRDVLSEFTNDPTSRWRMLLRAKREAEEDKIDVDGERLLVLAVR